MTKAVDLSLDGDSAGAGELDIDFASEPDDGATEIFDLGAESGPSISDETGQVPIPPDSGAGIDFNLDDDDGLDLELAATGEVPAAVEEATAEEVAIPEAEATAEIDLDELDLDIGAMDDTQTATDVADDSQLMELGDFDDVAALADEETSAAADDDDAETGKNPEIDEGDMLAVSATREMPTNDDALEDTADVEATEEQATPGFADDVGDDALAETGRNPEVESIEDDRASESMIFHIDDTLAGTFEMPSAADAGDETSETSLLAAIDEPDDEAHLDSGATGIMPVVGDDEAAEMASADDLDSTDVDLGLDTSLLDATGQTQVLPEDEAVESHRHSASTGIGDDEETHAADETGTLMAPSDDDGEFDFARTEALPSDVFSNDVSADDGGDAPELPGATDLDLDLDDLTAALKVSEVGDTINQPLSDATVEQPNIPPDDDGDRSDETGITRSLSAEDLSFDIHTARTMTEVGTKLDLARAYVDMGDPEGAKSILEEVLDEGDEAQRQQAQQLLDTLPS